MPIQEEQREAGPRRARLHSTAPRSEVNTAFFGGDYVEVRPSQLIDPGAARQDSNSFVVSDDGAEQQDPTSEDPQPVMLPGVKFIDGVGYVVGDEVPGALSGRMDAEQIEAIRKMIPRARKASKAAINKAARKQLEDKLMSMGSAERAAYVRFSGIAMKECK
jgi:hypothetical protein